MSTIENRTNFCLDFLRFRLVCVVLFTKQTTYFLCRLLTSVVYAGVRWEDSIADRTLSADRREGILAHDKAT